MSGFDTMIDEKITEHGGDIRRLAGELIRLENSTKTYGQYFGDCVRTPMPEPVRCREQTAAEAAWLAAYEIPGVVFGRDGQLIDVRGCFVDHCTQGLIVRSLASVQDETDAARYRWLAAAAPEAVCTIAWRIRAACDFDTPNGAVDAARAVT